MAAFLVVLAIILACVALVVIVRNNIIRHHNATIRSWADVASFERQKLKILDELQPVVEQYTQFEHNTLTKVTELRQNIMNLNVGQADISQLQRIEGLNQELMRNLNVMVEAYPDLKANQLYLKMMHEIEEQNENVGAAITIFNRNVELFNNYIQVFPNNIVNTITTSKQRIRPFRDNKVSFDYRPNF